MLVGVDLDQAGVNGKAFVSIGRTIVLLVHMCASAETNPAADRAPRRGRELRGRPQPPGRGKNVAIIASRLHAADEASRRYG
jgi:hypothetical protein